MAKDEGLPGDPELDPDEDAHIPPSGVTLVPLRRRSSPYSFRVTIGSADRTLALYDGKSYSNAMTAYWQAVEVAAFLFQTAIVRVRIDEGRESRGGFHTTLTVGKREQVHEAEGDCKNWRTLPWSERYLVQRMIAYIPGTLGLTER